MRRTSQGVPIFKEFDLEIETATIYYTGSYAKLTLKQHLIESRKLDPLKDHQLVFFPIEPGMDLVIKGSYFEKLLGSRTMKAYHIIQKLKEDIAFNDTSSSSQSY